MGQNEKKILHLGADLDTKLVKTFRSQTKKRKFIKKEVLRKFAEWWIMQDINVQKQFYHHTGEEGLLQIPDDEFREKVLRIVKDAQGIPAEKKSEKQANPSKSA